MMVMVDDLDDGSCYLEEDVRFDMLWSSFGPEQWHSGYRTYHVGMISLDPPSLEVHHSQNDVLNKCLQLAQFPTGPSRQELGQKVHWEVADAAVGSVGSAGCYALETFSAAVEEARFSPYAWLLPRLRGGCLPCMDPRKYRASRVTFPSSACPLPWWLISTQDGWADTPGRFSATTPTRPWGRHLWTAAIVGQKAEEGEEIPHISTGWHSRHSNRVCQLALMTESSVAAGGLNEVLLFRELSAPTCSGRLTSEFLPQKLPTFIRVRCQDFWEDLLHQGHSMRRIDTRWPLFLPLMKKGQA